MGAAARRIDICWEAARRQRHAAALVFLSDAKDQVHGQSAQDQEESQDHIDCKLLRGQMVSRKKGIGSYHTPNDHHKDAVNRHMQWFDLVVYCILYRCAQGQEGGHDDGEQNGLNEPIAS